MRCLPYILVAFFCLTGCVSARQRSAALDLALTDIQAGRAEEGRGALKKMCDGGQSGACALLGMTARATHPLPILQSVTSAHQARFAVLTPGAGQLAYYLRSTKRLEVLHSEFSSHGSERGGVDQVEAFDLNPDETYELVAIGPGAELWDQREFHPLRENKRRPRIAVAGGLDDKYIEQQKIWPELLAQKPDLILLVGDNVYVDRGAGSASVSADWIWHRYFETRRALALFKADPLVPTLAVWNDHDFGKIDGDRTFAFKEAAQDAFFAFFPQRKPAPGFERGPGIAALWNGFGVRLALLDNRFFRSPNGVDLPDQTHFGLDQEKWLSEKLASVATPTCLVSGDPFFGKSRAYESYESDQPTSFARRLADWRKIKAPLIFISGDRHLSEIVKVPADRLGYPTYELTSSGLHAKLNPEALAPSEDPAPLAGVAGKDNYLMLEIMRARPGFLQMDVQARGLNETQLYQKTLLVRH